MSTCDNASHTSTRSAIRCGLDDPIDLTNHILSPFFVRDLYYQGCRFHSIANVFSLRCTLWTPAVCYTCSKMDQTPHGFPNKSFSDTRLAGGMSHCAEIYSHLCISDMAVKTALIGPFVYNVQRRGEIIR